MSDSITLTGIVATRPGHIVTTEGLAITSFRLATAQRGYDRETGEWVERETNWYTVTAFRALAVNAADSIVKGDRIIVAGRLRIRAWINGEKSGTTVEVEADAIGHDLGWGTTRVQSAVASVEPQADAQPDQADAPASLVPGLFGAGSVGGRVSTIPVGVAA